MSTLDSVFSTNWYDKSTCFDSDIFKNSPEKYKKNLVQFVNDGYTILEGAIPKNTIDKYLKSLSRDIDTGKYFSHGSEITQTPHYFGFLEPEKQTKIKYLKSILVVFIINKNYFLYIPKVIRI
jgi:hypothetical protein